MHKQLLSWRHANNFLTIAIVAICLYVIVPPIVPGVQFWFAERLGIHNSIQFPIYSLPATRNTKSTQKPRDNRVEIPSAHINELLVQGATTRSLNNGIWVIPHTSTPDAGSNTVLAGHRFMYTNQLFYNLDKVKMNDVVAIFWQGKEYNYQVTSITVVPPSAVDIQNPTEQSTLTMYTCTPLWTSKNRLVVKAKLIYKES